MNHRARLKRQNTLRVPRQLAPLLFAKHVNAMLATLPPMLATLKKMRVAAEAASVSLHRLSATMGALRNVL